MILVVGGGPGGMMAALAAARSGGRVILLEKNETLGKKLLLTGNGRCNLTHDADLDALVANTPGNGRFLYGAFSRFGSQDLRDSLSALGLETKAEPDGRVFPSTDRADDVLGTLEQALVRAGVTICTHTPVQDILTHAGRVTGVERLGRAWREGR